MAILFRTLLIFIFLLLCIHEAYADPKCPRPHSFLTLTVTPSSPNISANTPLGSRIATVSVTWNNSCPFIGTISFVNPYYDDIHTFAMSGNNLIVSPNALGLVNGTTQYVTLQASQ